MNAHPSERAAAGRAMRLLFLLVASLLPAAAARGQDKEPEAYLRFGPPRTGAPARYYVEVFMMEPLAGDLSAVRASLRDAGEKKLLSTTVEPSPPSEAPAAAATTARPVTNFRMVLDLDEEEILEKSSGFKVFVDVYPVASGNRDAEIDVGVDVSASLKAAAACRRQFSVLAMQVSNTPEALKRLRAVEQFLGRPDLPAQITAGVKQNGVSTSRTVRSVGPPQIHEPEGADDMRSLFVCVEFTQPPPPGEYDLSLAFKPAAPFELRRPLGALTLQGPNVADATADERDPKDFLDLGLTLTSSVADEEQDDGTTLRKRTTRGLADIFFAPALNLRTLGTLGDHGGWVQVVTPFYIDAKVSTGKITEDTLALNTVNLGFDYQFRHYLNTNAYPDLLRHAVNFKHTSDRDFKQDEFKLTYEFQPIFGAVNQPIGSAPNILKDEVVADDQDRFGLEIVPRVGFELGRVYRVRDPKEFEGVSRNLRRFYFGGHMSFNLTRHFRLVAEDLFYVRGESPDDRYENYFSGTIEAPLDRIGKTTASHALFFSFERGEQAPFTNPGVNVLKFGYRVRARGLLFGRGKSTVR